MALNLLTTDLNFTACQKMKSNLMENNFSAQLGKIEAGSLEAFLAQNIADVHASQNLRYRVFVEEVGANATPEMQAQKRDFDEFDDICDHLLIVDKDKNNQAVGSYRLLRRSQLPEGRKFYTEGEYDISKTLAHFEGEVMELGRSCVDINYRNRSTIQLLWRAIGEYKNKFGVKLMFGCASFHGSDHTKHAKQLSYLYHYHLTPEAFRPRALEHLYKPMNLIPKEELDAKEIIISLPPLIKGYLRLGATIGDGAFEDKNYNTTDVCIVVDTSLITDKYLNRYSAKTE